jgi:peptide deformylase
MLETMWEARGVGLAAPQIGLSQRLFVAVEYADEPDEEERPLRDLVRQVYVVVNPVITHREGLVEGLEGCLSLPGLYSEEVPRAERIRVEFQDEEGRRRTLELEGYMARVFQHEIDTWRACSSLSACPSPSGRPSWRSTGPSSPLPEGGPGLLEGAFPMRVAFFGTPSWAVPVLDALNRHHQVVLVVTQPDKPKGRGLKPARAPWPSTPGARPPLLKPERLKGNKEFLETFRAASPEVAVTAAYGKILPKEVLEVPPYGFLNLHPSLLPKYRGPAPVPWALIRGRRRPGWPS